MHGKLLLATCHLPRTVLRVATGHRLRGIDLQVAEQRRDAVALVRVRVRVRVGVRVRIRVRARVRVRVRVKVRVRRRSTLCVPGGSTW